MTFFFCFISVWIFLLNKVSSTPTLSEFGSVQTYRSLRETENGQTNIQQYELWEPKVISDTLAKWGEHYTDFIRVTTSQEKYGLPTAGGKDDCPFTSDVEGCLNYIITIQDYVSHPEGSDSSNRLPEVFWSGEVHGNEQVGPTAVLEASQLLLDSALCEALPRPAIMSLKDSDTIQREIDKAKECRQDLYDRGIDDSHRQWLARLVSTRRLVVVPTANALGYFRKVREEGEIDPNRDFPYDLTNPQDCMQTIAARTINEVYRQHMFQMSLTFHGGMEVIGYEWGAPSWDGSFSPDDIAQKSIASSLSRFAGGFKQVRPYAYGPMNDVVYAVNGGMEDWAYAGSFDPERVIQCEPITYGGYPKEKTAYTNATLRAFNMLVETSNDKIPATELLGTSLDVMNPESSGNGHVARNMKLALLALDTVQPYVSIRQVDDVVITDDIIPTLDNAERSCQTTKAVSIPLSSKSVTIKWIVGGAFEINNVDLWFAKWNDIPKLNCFGQPSIEDVKSIMQKGTIVGSTTGTGKFSETGATEFSGTIDTSLFEGSDKLAVIVSARVDNSWAGTVENTKPNIGPQSHIVNTRTNQDWYHQSGDKIIQGRLDWFSVPLTIFIGNTNQDTDDDKVLYLSNRFEARSSDVTMSDNFTPTSGANTNWLPDIFIVVVIGAVLVVAFRAYLRHTMRVSHRERVREFIDDPDAISPGLKEKAARKAKNGYSDYEGVELGDLTLMRRVVSKH